MRTDYEDSEFGDFERELADYEIILRDKYSKKRILKANDGKELINFLRLKNGRE